MIVYVLKFLMYYRKGAWEKMANIKSAQKRVDVSKRNQARNKSNSSKLKTQIKKFNQAIENNDVATAEKILPETFKVIDKSVTNGVIHKNAANDRKSTISKKLDELKKASK